MSWTRMRLSCLKRLQKFSSKFCLFSKSTHSLSQAFAKNQLRTMISENTKPSSSLSPNIPRFCFLHQKSLPFASMAIMLNHHRSYSSFSSDSTDISEWSSDLSPFIQNLLDSDPFLVFSVSSTLVAWILMPLILRKLHQYSMQSSAAATQVVPYEKTFWVALEDPVRYLITFVAFSHICVMIAPTNEVLQHLEEHWKEAVTLSFTLFFHRWTTNILAQISPQQSLHGQDQHNKFLNLQNVSSISINGIGGTMTLTEAGVVSVESVVIVGGMGAIIAFVARDVLANVFSGLYMQLSEPFTIGNTIKAGQVEGKVIEMGVTKTLLRKGEKMEVLVVPNSYFNNQVLVIEGGSECRGTTSKISFRIEAIDRIGKISQEMESMLTENGNVLLGEGTPYCYLSHIQTSHAELTLCYNLKPMGEDETSLVKQDIKKRAMKILKRHNADYLSCDSDSDSDTDADSDSDSD